MSNLFERMIGRAQGTLPILEPRRASQFEQEAVDFEPPVELEIEVPSRPPNRSASFGRKSSHAPEVPESPVERSDDDRPSDRVLDFLESRKQFSKEARSRLDLMGRPRDESRVTDTPAIRNEEAVEPPIGRTATEHRAHRPGATEPLQTSTYGDLPPSVTVENSVTRAEAREMHPLEAGSFARNRSSSYRAAASEPPGKDSSREDVPRREIVVSIGRIEVRAVREADRSKPARPAFRPDLPLEEYFRRREEGKA